MKVALSQVTNPIVAIMPRVRTAILIAIPKLDRPARPVINKILAMMTNARESRELNLLDATILFLH
jgi:hypothetical protein